MGYIKTEHPEGGGGGDPDNDNTIKLYAFLVTSEELTLTALNPLISSFQMEGFRRIEVTRDMKWWRI